MNTTGQPVQIKGRDYWVKVVDMLQQNWALIDGPAGAQVTVFFVNDRSGVFDRIVFASRDEASRGPRPQRLPPLGAGPACAGHDATAVPAVLRGEASERPDLLVGTVLAVTLAGHRRPTGGEGTTWGCGPWPRDLLRLPGFWRGSADA